MLCHMITLPLGLSQFGYGAREESVQEQLLALHPVLGPCNSIRFSVKRYSENCFGIDIIRRYAGGHNKDSFTGLIGDTIQLLHGRSVQIEGFGMVEGFGYPSVTLLFLQRED